MNKIQRKYYNKISYLIRKFNKMQDAFVEWDIDKQEIINYAQKNFTKYKGDRTLYGKKIGDEIYDLKILRKQYLNNNIYAKDLNKIIKIKNKYWFSIKNENINIYKNYALSVSNEWLSILKYEVDGEYFDENGFKVSEHRYGKLYWWWYDDVKTKILTNIYYQFTKIQKGFTLDEFILKGKNELK